MKLLITAATLFSLNVKAPVNVKPPVKEKAISKAVKPLSFPRDVNWIIGYFPSMPMLSLNWPGTSYPGIGPIPVVFQGTTYMVNPSSVAYLLMPGVTIAANTNYTMTIAGVNYYFRWDGSSSQCTITGHD
ncbi:MAG: hypothetical protein J7623_29790 [Chitinophaga sp.]|uniref:hypothetical protein n=1 Tax=Chitinophaga sp. TaxID=1869181 RepID=UPI001B10CA4F|nr:hypothetical protein [Chitinophaga sp.]MBO9732873.1 hypothetical protein [Chitinophaga sp.]